MPNPHDESLDYLIDLARAGFEDDLLRLMGERTRSELAEAVGVSAAFVSKVLNGSTNYTLRTMAKLGRAVGGILQVRLIDEHNEVVRIVSPETASRLDDAGLSTVGACSDQGAVEARSSISGSNIVTGPWPFSFQTSVSSVPTSSSPAFTDAAEETDTRTLESVAR